MRIEDVINVIKAAELRGVELAAIYLHPGDALCVEESLADSARYVAQEPPLLPDPKDRVFIVLGVPCYVRDHVAQGAPEWSER